MSPVIGCPAHDQFIALLRGTLPAAEAGPLAAHVETCELCVATLLALPPDGAARLGPAPADVPAQVRDLVARLTPAGPMPARLGHYRIDRLLGAGGMGSVYLATDEHLDRQVALKTMKPELAAVPRHRERFFREAKAAAAIEHDHIVPIYHVGEADGVPFIAMPFLRGQSLDAMLKNAGGPLPVHRAIRIAGEAAIGLHVAHRAGLIHRDVKPGNIWLEGERRRVKLLDFGLARFGTDEVHLTATGMVMGTPAYMAPEQARGRAVDHRADVFSLGCVLYQMLTARRPFTGPDSLAILTSLALDTPPPPHELNAECPRELSDLAMQMLAKDPDQRPASAGAVARALHAVQPSKATKPGADPDSGRTAAPAAPAVEAAPTVESAPTDPWAEILTEVNDPLRPATAKLAAVRRPVPWLKVAAGVAVALLAAVGLFAIVKAALATATGTLHVQVADDAEARFRRGELRLHEAGGRRQYTLAPGARAQALPVGSYQLELAGADGLKLDPATVTLEKNGTATVRVSLAAVPHVPAAGGPKVEVKTPDRRAAEFALSIGGAVKVNGEPREIKAAAGLPAEPFRLTGVVLTTNRSATDAGLAQFRDCKAVEELTLTGAPITNAGLTHFADCKGLKALALANTPVTDAGLAVFAACKTLTLVDLSRTRVSDAGMAHLKDCPALATLELGGTSVGDNGLANFRRCRRLARLGLWMTPVTDAGLANFKDCPGLAYLNLANTAVTDSGLASFAGARGLRELDLRHTKVTDAGLAHFRDSRNLARLSLAGTRVSDAGLAAFKDLPGLRTLNLGGTAATGAALGHFTNCKAIEELDLSGLALTGTALSPLGAWTNLTTLSLAGTKVSDADLVHLQRCPRLSKVTLTKTAVTATGVAGLQKALPRCKIEWDDVKK